MMSSKSSKCDIRPMQNGDLKAVIEIENGLFTDPWPRSIFEDGLHESLHFFIVGEIDEEIVGYAAYFLDIGEARLTNLAVAPEYQRKSIAKKLLNYILDVVKKADYSSIFLDVRPSNKAAVDLYRKFSFEKAYVRANYYENPPENALVMVKYLE